MKADASARVARGLADATLPVPGLISHSLMVAAVFLISIPIAYRFGPDPAKWSWLSLLVVMRSAQP